MSALIAEGVTTTETHDETHSLGSHELEDCGTATITQLSRLRLKRNLDRSRQLLIL